MWQEIPPETRTWSEDDWELYFGEQDRNIRLGCAEPLEDSTESPYPPYLDDMSDDVPEQDADLGELNAIPAWRAAVDLGENVYEFVGPTCGDTHGGPTQYIMRTLCRESCNVHDYLEAGHKLGYEEDTLCGNIAMCRRAARALDRCNQCLERLGGRGDSERARLIVRASVTRGFLNRRILEMRQKVWWR